MCLVRAQVYLSCVDAILETGHSFWYVQYNCHYMWIQTAQLSISQTPVHHSNAFASSAWLSLAPLPPRSQPSSSCALLAQLLRFSSESPHPASYPTYLMRHLVRLKPSDELTLMTFRFRIQMDRSFSSILYRPFQIGTAQKATCTSTRCPIWITVGSMRL